jgi:succinyl-CoA synthetase beta subunit
MKLYEYEGKALLAKTGIPVPKSDVVSGPHL